MYERVKLKLISKSNCMYATKLCHQLLQLQQTLHLFARYQTSGKHIVIERQFKLNTTEKKNATAEKKKSTVGCSTSFKLDGAPIKEADVCGG